MLTNYELIYGSAQIGAVLLSIIAAGLAITLLHISGKQKMLGAWNTNTCPYCGGKQVIKRGHRQKKYEVAQLYYCQHCKRMIGKAHSKRFDEREVSLALLEEVMSLCNDAVVYMEQMRDIYSEGSDAVIFNDIIKEYILSRRRGISNV